MRLQHAVALTPNNQPQRISSRLNGPLATELHQLATHIDLQQLDDVLPTQLVRQRCTNSVGQIELTEANQVPSAESFAVAYAQVPEETGKECRAIVRTDFPVLLKLNNVRPNLPKGLDHLRFDACAHFCCSTHGFEQRRRPCKHQSVCLQSNNSITCFLS